MSVFNVRRRLGSRNITAPPATSPSPPTSAAPAVAIAPRSRAAEPGDLRRAQLSGFAALAGDANAFGVMDNQIHFHPDRMAFNGFGILVVLVPSSRREPGVYLFDRPRHEWIRAYLLDDLPLATWVQVSGWDANAVPVQLKRLSDGVVAARWLARNGASVPPGEWDITGGPSRDEMKLAGYEHAAAMGRRFS